MRRLAIEACIRAVHETAGVVAEIRWNEDEAIGSGVYPFDEISSYSAM